MIVEQGTETIDRSPSNAWNLYVGQDICGDVQKGLDHEWLVTNGMGGYAAASIVGAATRSYHGLLVASLHPPVERVVMVKKCDEEITFPDGHILKLGVNEYEGGAIDPEGFQYLTSVGLEGDIPRFTYRLDDLLTLEKRVWMEYGQNTTYVQYLLHGAMDEESEKSTGTLTLTLFPFCLSRDYHSTTQGSHDWHFLLDSQQNRCRIRAYESAPAYELIAPPSAKFKPIGNWWWHVFHRRDHDRGLVDQEDMYQPGTFQLQLIPGKRITLVLTAEAESSAGFGGPQHEEAVVHAYARHNLRIRQILAVADRSTQNLSRQDPVRARLVAAADQFIAARPEYTTDSATGKQTLHLAPDRKTIIAGYPWFTDWGRDSMISLPGLLLATGRYSEARGLLKAFASFAHQGLIPNRFPDSGETLEYNTVDATLWMFHALARYLTTTGDWSLLKELFPTLTDIIDWHVRGTLYNIGVDPKDGLLHSGAPGVQLTWMDAKIGDWVVTPRSGKVVEVNALWYYTLSCMESWAVHLSTDATQYSQLRAQVLQHFAQRFWYEEGGYLYDVVDSEGIAGKNDASLRPNQLFAASLTHKLLTEAQTSSMLQKVTDDLLTPMGLRTLSPHDPNYHSHFKGDQKQRDSAYHQGAIWQWLIGPYIDVYLRVHNDRSDRSQVRSLLEPIIQHLWSTCLGTISELAEPEPPYTPAGCFAQAWSVAETLRCWILTGE